MPVKVKKHRKISHELVRAMEEEKYIKLVYLSGSTNSLIGVVKSSESAGVITAYLAVSKLGSVRGGETAIRLKMTEPSEGTAVEFRSGQIAISDVVSVEGVSDFN